MMGNRKQVNTGALHVGHGSCFVLLCWFCLAPFLRACKCIRDSLWTRDVMPCVCLCWWLACFCAEQSREFDR